MDRDERIAELEDALKRRDALIAELRAELVDTRKQSDARITELRAERDADRALAAEMAEYAQEALAMLEECDIASFKWREYEDLRDKYHALQMAYNELAAEHNRVVAATRPRQHIGRPLAASHSQKADVLKRREAGQSLRSIADDTGLSLRTVCTITEKADGVDRATRKRLERIDPARIRLSAAEHRSRKKILAELPGRFSAEIKRGKALLKEAKGL